MGLSQVGAYFERAPVRRAVLVAILLLGLGVRLSAVRAEHARTAYSRASLRGDESNYDDIAKDLRRGRGVSWPGRTPLYPAWIAAVRLIAGRSYLVIPYAQAVLSLSTIVLTYALTGRFFGYPAGMLAALLAAVSYVLIRQPLHFLTEVLYTPLLLLAVLALDRALRTQSARDAGLAGTALALTNLTRPTLFLFPVFAAAAFALYRRGGTRGVGRSILAYTASALIAVGPWIVYLHSKFGAWLPMATSNAILWQGSPEYYHLLRDSGYTYQRVWREKLAGPAAHAPKPMSVVGDRWWTQRAVRSIKSEPGTYLRYAGEKLITYWVGDPEADWAGHRPLDYAVLRRIWLDPVVALEIMIARALIFPALVAAWLMRRRWREHLAVYAVLVYNTLLHAATHAEARLSGPLQPLLIVLIVGAGAALVAPHAPPPVLPGPTTCQ